MDFIHISGNHLVYRDAPDIRPDYHLAVLRIILYGSGLRRNIQYSKSLVYSTSTSIGWLQDRIVAIGQDRCRIGWVQGRLGAGQVGCRTGLLQDRKVAGQIGCRTERLQGMLGAGQVGCRTGWL